MTNLKEANLKTIFGLDLRSLAVFRIGLALAVIADLVTRARALEAHYTDVGILPRTILIERLLRPWYWSIHLISGQPAVQVFLFSLAIGLAICLLFGYRTRLVTIASWALIISVQNRNPVLSFAGDHVLRAVLFWAMFLPLGACYSIDSALNSSSQPLPKRICNGATIAFIIQICFIYIWSAAFKTKSDLWWPTGDAVYYSLSFDQYTTAFGQFLLGFPNSFLRILTFAALGFEWVGPLLLFIPFYNSFFRIITIISFILLHIGFELCFDIGVLSYLSIVNWLCLIPSVVWDKAAQRLETSPRKGLEIYYDADCGFCKK
ncbi:MAG: HTTM domain-containing protein, partial [Cyanobacteriota bacterium]|nr:HTTM domain-containing protein [Cyanobacteriota bacterium]